MVYGLTILTSMAYIGDMKTTVEIPDPLFERTRRQARRTGRSMRSMIEEGLRLVLERAESGSEHYVLPDRSVGQPGGRNPLESLSWQELRDEIYGGR